MTILWTAANVVAHVGIGMALAMLLREPWLKLKGVYRVLLILPWAVPNYITALIWRGMFKLAAGHRLQVDLSGGFVFVPVIIPEPATFGVLAIVMLVSGSVSRR